MAVGLLVRSTGPRGHAVLLAVAMLAAGLAACRAEPAPAASATPTAASRATPTVTAPVARATPAPQAVPVRLPEDDAAHPNSVEWWYFNGHLEAEDGSRYGFHFVFFKLVPSPQAPVLLGQLALTDQQNGTYTVDQRIGSVGPEPAEGFEAAVADWRMAGFNGEFDLQASIAAYTLNLHLSARKAPVLHGTEGLLDMLGAGATYYYSYPRLEVSGTVGELDVMKPVSGVGWMDHQWGDPQLQNIGWDWFSVQLDDGTELMVSVVRERGGDGVATYGTYVDAAGASRPISAAEVAVRSEGAWKSPNSEIEYPSGWAMDIRALGLSLRLAPIVEQAEFPTLIASVPSYWEGAVAVTGRRDGRAITGRGFVELVGYGR